MRVKILSLAVLVFILAVSTTKSTFIHKYYTSITEIEYNPSEASLQIITRIFLDDLEKALSESTGNRVVFSSEDESKSNLNLLSEYLIKNLSIDINGKSVPVKFLGKRHENGQLFAYMEVQNIVNIQEIEVKNSVLMDAFEKQQNIIHTKLNGLIETTTLTIGNDQFNLKVSPNFQD